MRTGTAVARDGRLARRGHLERARHRRKTFEALAVVYEKLNPPLPILDEIAWGNRLFQRHDRRRRAGLRGCGCVRSPARLGLHL